MIGELERDGQKQTEKAVGGVSETQQHLLAGGSMASLSERNSSSCPKKPNSECICHKTDEKRKTHCGKSVGRKSDNPLRHTGEMAQRQWRHGWNLISAFLSSIISVK